MSIYLIIQMINSVQERYLQSKPADVLYKKKHYLPVNHRASHF